MLDEIKGIVKHSLLYGIGTWVRPLLAFTMIPIYTSKLDPEVYGDYNLLVLSVEIIGLILGGRVEAGVTRYYFDRREKSLAERVVTSALILALGIGLVLFLFGSLLSPTLTWLVFERRGEMSFTSAEYTSFFRMVFLTLLLQLGSQIGAAFVRIKKKSLTYSLVSVISLFLGLGCNILFVVVWEIGLIGVLWSSILTNLFLFLVYSAFVVRSVPLRFHFRDARDLLSYAVPLIPGSVGTFLITFGDRFVLNEFHPAATVGIYGLAYKFGILVSYGVTKPFMEFWRVRAYELFARGRVRLKQRRAVTYYSFCVTWAALLISLLIDQVIHVAKETYWDAAAIVPWIAFGYVFAGLRLIFELGIHFKKKTKFSSYVTVGSTVVNVALNLALIPSFGPLGAAISTFFTFFLMAIGSLVFSERLFRIRYNLNRIAALLGVALGLYGFSRWVAVDDFFVGGAINLLLGFSYPLVLFFFGFYRPEERRMIGRAVAQLREGFKNSRIRRSRVGIS